MKKLTKEELQDYSNVWEIDLFCCDKKVSYIDKEHSNEAIFLPFETDYVGNIKWDHYEEIKPERADDDELSLDEINWLRSIHSGVIVRNINRHSEWTIASRETKELTWHKFTYGECKHLLDI